MLEKASSPGTSSPVTPRVLSETLSKTNSDKEKNGKEIVESDSTEVEEKTDAEAEKEEQSNDEHSSPKDPEGKEDNGLTHTVSTESENSRKQP